MTQLRLGIVNLTDSPAEQLSLSSRLLSLLSARLIPRIEDWKFLSILAKQLIDPLPEDQDALIKQINQHEKILLQEIFEAQDSTDPLARLIRTFNLSFLEINILLLALAPELDERFGDLYSHINGFPKERRLPLHKACLLLLDQKADRNQTRKRLIKSALWQSGLLVLQEQHSLFERHLQVSHALLKGVDLDDIINTQEIELHQVRGRLLIQGSPETRPDLMQQAKELAAWSQQQQQAVIIFKAENFEMITPYINALANALRLPWFTSCCVATIGMKDIILTSIMLDAIPVIHSDGDKPFSLTSNVATLLNGLLIILTHDHNVSIPLGIAVRKINAYPPKPIEQAKLWQHHLQDTQHDINIDLLANQNRINHQQIESTLHLARNFANQEQSKQLNEAHISRALREIIHEPASPYTTTEWPEVPWQSLVLNRQVIEQLEALVSRVYQRITVESHWDMSSEKVGGSTGLVALLHGESGTGKTFVAKAVASRLGLPLLRVDLSRIVSKYIGETEKNLSQVFNIAEGYRGLLFFDEADSLFGKRTGIKDSHDRNANLQVNFLLQRLEQFEGITLLASNFQQNMDSAFTRRISFSVHFPRPTPPQQLRLWQSQLPKVSLAEIIDLERFVDAYDLVGGEIRNCALRAAYAAANQNTLITQVHLEDAILQEFIKMGRPQPSRRITEHRN